MISRIGVEWHVCIKNVQYTHYEKIDTNMQTLIGMKMVILLNDNLKKYILY